MLKSRMRFRSILNFVIDILIPESCLNCGSYEGGALCSTCLNLVQEYEPESFISRKPSLNWVMTSSEREASSLEKVYYFYHYNKIIHDLIESIKYDFNQKNVRFVLELLRKSKEFQKIDFAKFDYLTFVPLSTSREKWRRFNHTKLITHEISAFLKIPYFQLLTKTKETKAQIDLSREERLENLNQAFTIKENLPTSLTSQNILLIDDICTTGTTLIECAKVIKKAFPETKIYGLCLGRG